MSAAVLLVDDDAAIRECIAEVLAMEGFEVQQASNGREGLEVLVDSHPQVVVLDLMMPVMNGWQFLDEQKQRPDVATVPVVVTTACGDQPPGAACVLHKPFDMDVLLGVVEELAAHEGARCSGRAARP